MHRTLSFEDIHPFIRLAQVYQITPESTYARNLKAYDYRLFYVYNGKGTVEIDNMKYTAEKGQLFLWQPGLEYTIITKHRPHMEMLQLNFDFTQNNRNLIFPIAPDNVNQFNEDNIVEIIHFDNFKPFNRPLILKNMGMIENILIEIKNEFTAKKKYFDSKISALFLLILSTIARVESSINVGMIKKDQKIDMIIKYIHENYNKNITNKSIGKIFNFHPNYINNIMVLNTGKSLHKYLLAHRISEAINLIQTTDMTISEIAYSVGFNDVCHFSKQFKKITGSCPMNFRKSRQVTGSGV